MSRVVHVNFRRHEDTRARDLVEDIDLFHDMVEHINVAITRGHAAEAETSIDTLVLWEPVTFDEPLLTRILDLRDDVFGLLIANFQAEFGRPPVSHRSSASNGGNPPAH